MSTSISVISSYPTGSGSRFSFTGNDQPLTNLLPLLFLFRQGRVYFQHSLGQPHPDLFVGQVDPLQKCLGKGNLVFVYATDHQKRSFPSTESYIAYPTDLAVGVPDSATYQIADVG